MRQRRPRPMDEYYTSVAALADPEKLRLAAARALALNEPQPGGEIAAVLKCSSAPITAIKAEAIGGPTPGILARSRASAFSRSRTEPL